MEEDKIIEEEKSMEEAVLEEPGDVLSIPKLPIPQEKRGIDKRRENIEFMFTPPQEGDADIYTADLVERPSEPDIDDLVRVPREEIMGGSMSDDLSDIFEPPQENDSDMRTDDILEAPEIELGNLLSAEGIGGTEGIFTPVEEPQIDDLVNVSRGEILGDGESLGGVVETGGIIENYEPENFDDIINVSQEEIYGGKIEDNDWAKEDIEERMKAYRPIRKIQPIRIRKPIVEDKQISRMG